LFGEKGVFFKVIIDQTINFSKTYLGVEADENEKKYEKHRYINKVLDLISKEKYKKDEEENKTE
jgi:hypothetical protein